ncbi:putative 3-oxoacyl-[acp] synthase [Campylobacter iguaniorum]|uniref:Putative 3-oxoacyl-[acp] synthase n=1 Tax=Campylobacter iguaniorum TaxID=1244531 RepID=A0A076FCX5_9BACT|nr:beta-ketoacyl synthase N-terminal-like domain-containing protein [Campylobacter iguaniorum]AII15483.1 putative 3-oxoacyl-[acp] synthase [Campylobacter iguaniorum]
MKVFISKPSILSSAGDEKELLQNAFLGKSALQIAEVQNKSFMVAKVADKLLDFKFIKESIYQTRTNQIALSAILPLCEQIAKLTAKYGRQNIGVVVGTTTSGVEENYRVFENGKFDMAKFDLQKHSLSNPAKFIRDFLGLSGVAYSISTACTSGIKAISEAKNLVESGICKAVIAGGVDSLNTLTLFGFDSLGILSRHKCDPFGKLRDGTNLGEGAAFMIVGSNEVGEIRIKSAMANCDAFHMTSPRSDGFYQANLIKSALNAANLSDVDYLSLHATGTVANDLMESNAVFSSGIKSPSSGIKQLIGHTLGAAGAIESGLCALVLGDSFLPLQSIKSGYDDALQKINLVTNLQKKLVKNTMSLSFAFGGDNACIILGVDDD